MSRVWAFFFWLIVASTFFVNFVSADRYTSANYTIDASQIGNSFGGDSTDADYQLTSSGGESLIGQGSGGSYRLDSGYIAQIENSLELKVVPGGLQAYYPMDEGSGSLARDYSSQTNDGILGGTPTLPTWATGQIGESVHFDGANDELVTAGTHAYNTVTVSAWVKAEADAVTGNRGVVSNSRDCCGTYGGYQLEVNHPDATNVNARFRIWNSTGTTSYGTNDVALTTGVWTHLVGTYDGSDVKLYKNGTLADTNSSYSGTINTPTANIKIGNMGAYVAYFKGTIDEAMIFNRALSADEVEAMYDAGSAGNIAGLSFAGDIIPGTSQTSDFDAIMATDSYGYSLAISQDQNLTKGGDSIPAISANISSPASWSEGTTKGLGFTLYGTNATALDAKWSSGSNYSAFPSSATSIYTRIGQQSAKDVLNMRLRLDVDVTQPTGLYANVVTTTGTITP